MKYSVFMDKNVQDYYENNEIVFQFLSVSVI